MNTVKPLAYMLVGTPGSGKSTWAARILEDSRTALISTDAYIERMAEAVGKTYGEVFESAIKDATALMKLHRAEAIAKAMNIVWDQTNLTIKSRRPKIDSLRESGYDIVAVTFEIPDEELRARRKAREEATGKAIAPSILEQMGKDYQRPTRLEGFNKVIIVTPFEEYECTD
jgi:predicted kinase